MSSRNTYRLFSFDTNGSSLDISELIYKRACYSFSLITRRYLHPSSQVFFVSPWDKKWRCSAETAVFPFTQTQLQSNLRRVLQSNVRRRSLRGQGQRKHRWRQAIFPLFLFEKVKKKKKEQEKSFLLACSLLVILFGMDCSSFLFLFFWVILLQ